MDLAIASSGAADPDGGSFTEIVTGVSQVEYRSSARSAFDEVHQTVNPNPNSSLLEHYYHHRSPCCDAMSTADI